MVAVWRRQHLWRTGPSRGGLHSWEGEAEAQRCHRRRLWLIHWVGCHAPRIQDSSRTCPGELDVYHRTCKEQSGRGGLGSGETLCHDGRSRLRCSTRSLAELVWSKGDTRLPKCLWGCERWNGRDDRCKCDRRSPFPSAWHAVCIAGRGPVVRSWLGFLSRRHRQRRRRMCRRNREHDHLPLCDGVLSCNVYRVVGQVQNDSVFGVAALHFRRWTRRTGAVRSWVSRAWCQTRSSPCSFLAWESLWQRSWQRTLHPESAFSPFRSFLWSYPRRGSPSCFL